MMDEKNFEELLASTARDLEIPSTPREEMWAKIQQERANAKVIELHNSKTKWRVANWSVAAAAMLAVGIGIGRISANRDPQTATLNNPAAAPAPANTATAYKVVVSDHMAKAEALLTSFRTQPQGTMDPELAVWARDLLTNTRMLMDSPAAKDPKVAALLGDLELIIAQIAQMQAPSKVEREIIKDGMNKTAVLPRVRASQIVSAGT